MNIYKITFRDKTLCSDPKTPQFVHERGAKYELYVSGSSVEEALNKIYEKYLKENVTTECVEYLLTFI